MATTQAKKLHPGVSLRTSSHTGNFIENTHENQTDPIVKIRINGSFSGNSIQPRINNRELNKHHIFY